MASTALTGRYANALFELAEEQSAIDATAKDLEYIDKLIEESPELSRLVRSPAINRDDQAKAIDALLVKGKATPLVRSFIGVTAKNGRLFTLKAIIKHFLENLAARRGEIAAEVVSAVPLKGALEDEVRAAVKHVAGSDKVSLTMRVDPSLIGGLIVRVGSRMIDSSIRSKLNRLELTMKGAR